jgi:hypothetical protein
MLWITIVFEDLWWNAEFGMMLPNESNDLKIKERLSEKKYKNGQLASLLHPLWLEPLHHYL